MPERAALFAQNFLEDLYVVERDRITFTQARFHYQR